MWQRVQFFKWEFENVYKRDLIVDERGEIDHTIQISLIWASFFIFLIIVGTKLYYRFRGIGYFDMYGL